MAVRLLTVDAQAQAHLSDCEESVLFHRLTVTFLAHDMSANPWAGEAYIQAGHYDRVVTLALNAGIITQRTPEPDSSAPLHPSLQLINALDGLSALTDKLAELSGDVQDEFLFRQTMDLIDMASIGELSMID